MTDATTPDSLSLRMFGPMRVLRGGAALEIPASRKTRAILGFLALTGRPTSRQRLCDLFFDRPDDPRAALRWSLAKIRLLVDAPGRPRLVAERDSVRIDLSSADLDVATVLALAARPPEAASDSERRAALALIAGDLLEDCELPDRPDYAAWLASQRQDMHAIALRLARTQAERASGEQRIVDLHRVLALDPLDEAAAASLARALVAAGRRDDAHAIVAATERAFLTAGLQAGPALRMSLRSGRTAAPPPVAAQPPSAPPSPAALDDGRVSVAVMPFLNHSKEAISDDLMDGLLEATVHMLSKFRDIRVAGVAKALQFKGAVRDPAAMGEALGVGLLIGGSVMVRDGAMKLRYRLVSAQDGALITSGDIEHAGADTFALLEDGPARLTVVLAKRLIDFARAAAIAAPAERRNAWQHYYAAVAEGFAASPAKYELALQHLNRALDAAPAFARAVGAAAWSKACLGYADRPADRQEALMQAHRAIRLGGDDAETLAVAGWAAVHVAGDFDAALRAAEQAVRANPLSRVAWSTAGWIRTMAGETETPLHDFDRAEACAADETHLDNVDGGRAFAYWLARRYDDAERAANRSIERLPGHVGAHAVAMASALAKRDLRAARDAGERFLRVFPDGVDTAALASIPLRDAESKRLLLHAVGEACAAARA
ncbi:MAG: BTAD domain-containing putative transcriptional regulator [Hyphomonadaceae bacterium]|nr:BTAD domain-containing putative transcriptional regulator [Hyphomonadaceae bacterium]